MLEKDELYYLLGLVEAEQKLKGKFFDSRISIIADKLREMLHEAKRKEREPK